MDSGEILISAEEGKALIRPATQIVEACEPGKLCKDLYISLKNIN